MKNQETPATPAKSSAEEAIPEHQEKKYIFTDDQSVIDCYTRMAQKVITPTMATHPLHEQLNILCTRVNRFLPALQVTLTLPWREINNVFSKGGHYLLMNGKISQAEKERIIFFMELFNDFVLRIVEERTMVGVTIGEYTHHQNNLCRMLHRKPNNLMDKEIYRKLLAEANGIFLEEAIKE